MNIVFRGEKMVWEQLKEELIFPKLEASNSKEVFERVGGKFIEEGFCKDSTCKQSWNSNSNFRKSSKIRTNGNR
mgnify:CR=1 FL=1